MDAAMREYDVAGGPGASIAVVRGGTVAYVRAYGLADLETRTAAAPPTSYRLASLTKHITAAAVVRLVRDGRLAYDDAIGDLLPGLPDYAKRATVRQLLTHTSGLPDYETYVPDDAPYQVNDADVPALLRRAPGPLSPAGTAFRYSNTGYALLALIVEQRAGTDFTRHLDERFFRPLGLRSMVAHVEGRTTVPNRAWGYSAASPGWRRTDQSPTSAVLGDGGVYASVEDLARWLIALDEGQVLTREEQELALTPAGLPDGADTPYGFGWFVDREGDRVRAWHHGETVGFTNGVVRYPAARGAVVILTNRTGGEPWAAAGRIAARLFR
ncbi:MAG TPA: serine hydrolase domain-containing protein [Gemmatimonadaceae bacterium]|nr:serine hydrolase domain-containing protein [Gemmatimonadaceae bacterium]